MTEAEKLLATLDVNDPKLLPIPSKDDGYIVIGEDRIITVPDALKRIAVQYDIDVEAVMFECPRYFNGIDLTKLDLYVNYIRADGGPSSYHIEDVTINPENDKQIHFTWLIGGYLTEVAGNLQFIVSGSKTDESGNVVNKWNTEINSDLYISKSIGSAEYVAALYPDIVTQLLTRLKSTVSYRVVGKIAVLPETETKIACTGIVISTTELLMFEPGKTEQLTTIVTPSNTTDVISWKSSNVDVATVTNTGLVKAVGYGTAEITVTCGTQTAICHVNVKQTGTDLK